MARRLKGRDLKPDRILSSPAVRAITTATIMARELGVAAAKVQQDERLYLAAPKDLLKVVRELGGTRRHLMVVGHNPGITEFADRLSGERSVDNLPTCAVYTLRVRDRGLERARVGTRRQRRLRLPEADALSSATAR